MRERIRRILVVDDEPGICAILSRHIRNEGLEARTAGSAEEAVALAGQESFDLILMDVCLPGMTGFRAIELLKKKVDTAIVLMTGYASDETRRDAELLGAAGLIAKPVELQELLPIIRGEALLRRKE